jgi:pSer/pThr/pTyr-binding forkhead associated (FHA) protein
MASIFALGVPPPLARSERRGTSPRTNQNVSDVYILEVVSGPLDGKTWAFEREITIGRDDGVVDACISLDRYVSRRHACLRENGEGLVLTDLESRNGTNVAGEPVGDGKPIAPGERFQVGHTLLRVRRTES